MSEIKLIIQGNQENPKGNPLGYKRTLNHSWRADSTKYVEWCRYVRQNYYQQIIGKVTWKEVKDQKPLSTSKDQPVEVNMFIEYANDVRPDGDNVFKGICDALFENDKYIMAGSFKSKYSTDKIGRVEIIIKL